MLGWEEKNSLYVLIAMCQAFLEESIILNFLALSYHYMSKKYWNFNYFSYIIIWKFQQSYILGEKK